MLCDNCKVNPATTQFTRISGDGQRQTVHLCETCATRREIDRATQRFGPFGLEEESPFFSLGFPGSANRSFTPRRQEAINISDYFSERAKKALQSAAQLAIKRNHQVLDTEHLLQSVAQEEEVSEKILRELGVKPEDLITYLKNAVPPGSSTVESPDLSPRAKRVLQLAFDESQALGHEYVGTEHILLGLVREGEGLAAQTLKKYAVDLTKARAAVIKLVGEGLKEDEEAKEPSKTPTLDQFSRDLTSLAQKGQLDPVIGRQKEIERVVNILSRRTKNNPVLIGEPGVGKTAIAEGLALRITKKEVPESLYDKRVIALDLAGLVAGTRYRGEFEERIKKALEEITSAGKEIILFIDELHTLVGAGAAEGAIDAANILKPALARGELQAIGATTLSEYKKYVEKDAALERRFQPIVVPENTVEETIEILQGLRDRYEAHHRVKISDEAIGVAAKLSDRYLQDRFLPDKAIDLIDEASAEVRLRSVAPPENLQQAEAEVRRIQKELEAAKGAKDKKKIQELEAGLIKAKTARDEIKEVWQKTKGTEQPGVTGEDIAAVLSKITGIPVTKLTQEEREQLLELENKLHEKIVGQDEAVQAVAQAIRRSRAGLKDLRRPIGVFMFLGPTGVGKTELTRVLAEILYGSSETMIRLDMSEFQERHSVARLIGSPPGYIGFEEGGQLTEQVRRKPFSIILLDEIEKAHPDVFNLLLQIMEDGRLTDGKGRVVNFKNTILIMTSNLGSELINQAAEDKLNGDELQTKLEKIIKATFRPEFINRVDEFVVFKSLSEEQIAQIVDLQLEETRRLAHGQGLEIKVEKPVKRYLVKHGYDPQFGARPIRRLIQKELENPLAEKLIQEAFSQGDTVQVKLGRDDKITFTRTGKH